MNKQKLTKEQRKELTLKEYMNEYEYCEKNFSLVELERISETTDFCKRSSRDVKKILDVAWLILKKEEATEKGVNEAIKEAIVLITLFFLKRKGILDYDKKGRWKDTQFGKELRKELKKKKESKK